MVALFPSTGTKRLLFLFSVFPASARFIETFSTTFQRIISWRFIFNWQKFLPNQIINCFQNGEILDASSLSFGARTVNLRSWLPVTHSAEVIHCFTVHKKQFRKTLSFLKSPMTPATNPLPLPQPLHASARQKPFIPKSANC